MEYLCECEHRECHEVVEVPLEEYRRIVSEGLYIISNNCPGGLSEEDKVIEKKETYTVYRPKENIQAT